MAAFGSQFTQPINRVVNEQMDFRMQCFIKVRGMVTYHHLVYATMNFMVANSQSAFSSSDCTSKIPTYMLSRDEQNLLAYFLR